MRNLRYFIILAGAVILWAACSPAAAAGIPCARIVFSSPEETPGTFSDHFSATHTVDMTVSILFNPRDMKTEHVVELRFYTPKGNLYQSIAVPVAAMGKQPETRMLADYPRAKAQVVPTIVVKKDVKYAKADFPFPVGGTLIVSNSLYGQWRVEAYVDGEAAPCGAPAYFYIYE